MVGVGLFGCDCDCLGGLVGVGLFVSCFPRSFPASGGGIPKQVGLLVDWVRFCKGIFHSSCALHYNCLDLKVTCNASFAFFIRVL